MSGPYRGHGHQCPQIVLAVAKRKQRYEQNCQSNQEDDPVERRSINSLEFWQLEKPPHPDHDRDKEVADGHDQSTQHTLDEGRSWYH